MAGFKMGLLGEFETILPDEEMLSPEQYLLGVNKKVLLRTAFFLLGLNPDTSQFNDWRTLIKMWFRQENNEFAIKIFNKCYELEQKGNKQISLIFPLASLRFFEFAFSLPDSSVIQDEKTPK